MTAHKKIKVPSPMKVQLSRLFGAKSREVSKNEKTAAEWKRTLKKVLDELSHYMEGNIDTDGMHTLMLYSGLAAAHEALKEENYWPGYVEGITRFALLLMGDYPDHRRRKSGKKKKEHYSLKSMRSVTYIQDTDQRIRTMLAASQAGFPQLSQNPREAIRQFREEQGFDGSYKEFLRWFREKYPADYAALF